MELRTLKNFLVVAREGNVTRAAELLHMSQSALSRQIMALETELGAKLFARGRSSVTLTNEGELLSRRAREMLELANKAEQEVASGGEEISGTISIGSCDSRGKHTLVEIMTKFRRLHPRVTFKIFSMPADSIRERIERGQLDIGLMVEPVGTEKLNYVRLKETDTWGILMPESWQLARKERIRAEDLIGVPLMMPRRILLKNELTNWFGELYEKMDVVLDFNIGFNTAELVRGGLGAAMSFIREMEEHAGLCCRPLEPELHSGSIIGWKKGQHLAPVMEEFVAMVKECV